MQVAQPTFPLTQPPTCRTCGYPGRLGPTVSGSNPINAGRPYYRCSRPGHGFIFITFDDNIGIDIGNPPCVCGYTSRLSSRRDGDGQFLSCPKGMCHFMQDAPPSPPQMTQIQREANGIGMDVDMMDVD